MLDLTLEQAPAMDTESLPPRVRDPRTNTAYVLVRAEVYDRLRGLLEDDGDLSMPQVARLVDQAMQEEDAGDPTLAFYQEKYGRKT